MPAIATLIAKPGTDALDHDTLARTARALGGEAHWLGESSAADISFPAIAASREQRLEMLRPVLDVIGSRPIDAAILPPGPRRKMLLVADMDSTMIEQECIDELAAMAGVKDRVADITRRAMNGEIAFEPALRERVALLKGLPEAIISQVLADRITYMPGGRTLIATMRVNGAHCSLVSGGFTAFTGPVAAALGFHDHRANILETDGLHLSGSVREPILGREAKVDALESQAAALGIDPIEAVAVGDGANDLGMILRAGLGVALHAKPSVAAEADVRIDHGDLTALLYLQGYHRAQFKDAA
jgi:phosphoserine phosphatase